MNAISRYVEDQIRQAEVRMLVDEDSRRDSCGRRKPHRPPKGKRGGLWHLGYTSVGTSYWVWQSLVIAPPFYVSPASTTFPEPSGVR